MLLIFLSYSCIWQLCSTFIGSNSFINLVFLVIKSVINSFSYPNLKILLLRKINKEILIHTHTKIRATNLLQIINFNLRPLKFKPLNYFLLFHPSNIVSLTLIFWK